MNKNRYYLLHFVFLGALCVIFLATIKIQACRCDVPTWCQAYSRADAVFTGKLIKTEVAGRFSVRSTFEVEKVFKGTREKIEVAVFRSGDCGPKLVVDEQYFVYKEAEDNPNVCNRTMIIDAAGAELIYANSLSTVNPTFKVGGRINISPAEDLKAIKLTIKKGPVVWDLPIDQFGRFDFTTEESGEFLVKVEFPSERDVKVKNLGYMLFSTGNSVEYKVQFRPNECDYREIELYDAKGKENPNIKAIVSSANPDNFCFWRP